MKNLKELKALALKLPHLPGVYQYKDDADQIIYIGKAKDLHKRVNSYFRTNQDLKTNLLLSHIHDIEYTVTPSEIDALTLEDQLINQYQPKYNILLKSDSSYRYICLTKTNPPKITTSRRPIKNQYCLGPFPFATHQVVSIARDILGLTKYQQLAAPDWQLYLDASNFSKNKRELVLSDQLYQDFINKLIKTIKHGDKSLIEQYQKHMQAHADKLEFEQALQYKHKIELLNKLTQRTSQINPTQTKSEHLLILLEHHHKILIFLFSIQNGLLHSLGDFKFSPDYPDNILETFLKQYYTQHTPPTQISIYIESGLVLRSSQSEVEPTQINIYVQNDITPVLRLAQDQRLGLPGVALAKPGSKDIPHFIDPLIGEYLKLNWSIKPKIEFITSHKLLNLALQNIKAKINLKTDLNQALKKLLNLAQAPQTIDFVDISNLSDQIVVGGVVRYVNGEPVKSLWRHYTIKTTQGQDDYASISETILRRYSKITPPDILFVDGGIGQLNAALKSLPSNCHTLAIGLAKAQETLIFANQNTIKLSLKNLADKFIIKARDSVHNFVVGHTRRVFKKFYKQSELDNIAGIGPSTKIKLLKYFKAVDQIKIASLPELAKLIGINKAQIIFNYFISKAS